MSTITASYRADFKGANVDLFFTGDAARIAEVDRRTFISWAKKLRVDPLGYGAGNRAVYSKEAVEKIAKAIKTNKAKKEQKGK